MKKTSFLIFASLLSGCAFLGQQEPLPLYTLKSGTFEPQGKLPASLAIDIPLSEASLNTSRIAVTPSPFQRNYLADGEWPDRLPKILQEVLIESLGQRWGEVRVNRMAAGLETKYLLQPEIKDFSVYHLEEGAPEVHLKVTFKLINLRNRQAIAAHTFTEIIPSSSPTMNEIVESFNKGLYCMIEKTIPWIEEVLRTEK
ncbi:MAG: membrane integrity-associated transporter subunit PqiC [Proteobacteria bacterium]|nr:membrane integrity-associated transporter subunit PqiC [Pseudomonadota bacterium]